METLIDLQFLLDQGYSIQEMGKVRALNSQALPAELLWHGTSVPVKTSSG